MCLGKRVRILASRGWKGFKTPSLRRSEMFIARRTLYCPLAPEERNRFVELVYRFAAGFRSCRSEGLFGVRS
jgi:hypothetical protein